MLSSSLSSASKLNDIDDNVFYMELTMGGPSDVKPETKAKFSFTSSKSKPYVFVLKKYYIVLFNLNYCYFSKMN